MNAINWLAIFEQYADRGPQQLSANAETVLRKRYLKKDEQGQPSELPADMFRRVAENVAQAEARLGRPELVEPVRQAFLHLMTSLDFLPNSPTLMNAGRPLQQLAACFVLPVEDSISGIFEAVKATALIHQTGGGTGFSFARLRPRGDLVSTSNGVASGPVSFMKVFNEATRAISQGGFRRGANMGILRVDHPDIHEFIACKETEGAFENFNISVAATDLFMQAVAADRPFELRSPRKGTVAATVSARELWTEIVRHAWANGEPGLFFVDRADADNPTPQLGPIESTNPCGEQPLLPYEACNLGSLNLAHFVAAAGTGPAANRAGQDADRPGPAPGKLDYQRLRDAIHLAIRFLDDAIEMSHYPLPEIDRVVKGNRKIGLGVMGWADLLIDLGVPYDSPEALKLAEELMTFVEQEARQASRQLAAERGPFPNFPGSRYDLRHEPPQRHATVTTVAPTGTLSLIAGCSAGIEPIFSVAFERHVLSGERLLEVQPSFERIARQRGFHSEALMQSLTAAPLGDRPEVPADVRRLFVTAHEIAPEWHVRMQAAFQKHTDNAVSKTVNLPSSAKVEEVDRIYRLAYDLGCKGITIYRDHSRQEQVLVRHNGRPMVCADCLPTPGGAACPECGRQLDHESGCVICHECGYTKC